jgi:hypothetical protein
MTFLTTANCMMIWRFQDAPAELQALSQHGGDEDYLAYVPSGGDFRDFEWLERAWFGEIIEPEESVFGGTYTLRDVSGSPFGCCSIDRHVLDNGARVYIGAHA